MTDWNVSEDGPDTEAVAVATLAQQALGPQEIAKGFVGLSTPAGLVTFETEQYAERPFRAKGTVNLTRQESFTDYIARHRSADTVIYAVEGTPSNAHRLVGILNDHGDDAGEAVPGWRDWMASYVLVPGESWKAWTGLNGKSLRQPDLIDFLEEHVEDVTDPPEARLLTIVQTLSATRTLEFRSAVRLDDGTQQLTYVEKQEAGAGPARDLAVPSKIKLALEPVRGSGLYAVDAAFRYRIHEGGLHITVKLERLTEVYRLVFEEIVEQVRTVLNGENLEEADASGYAIPILYGTL